MSKSFYVGKSALADALSDVMPAISTNNDYPLLQNVLLQVNSNSLKLTASNKSKTLVRVLISTVECSSSIDDVVIPAKLLQDVLKKAPSVTLEIIVGAKEIIVKADNTTWTIKIVSNQKYPQLEEEIQGKTYQLRSKELIRAIGVTRSLVIKNLNRPSLRMLNFRDGKATSCDGARLQQTKIKDFPTDLDFSLPEDTISDILNLAEREEYLEFGFSAHCLVFRTSNITLFRLIPELKYPDVEPLLLRPALENNQLLMLDCDELKKSINRVAIVADSHTKAIGLAITKGYVTVTSKDGSANGATATIAANWRLGDRTLVVNYLDLLDMLKNYPLMACYFYLGKETKSRRSVIVLKDESAGTIGVIPQMYGRFEIF